MEFAVGDDASVEACLLAGARPRRQRPGVGGKRAVRGPTTHQLEPSPTTSEQAGGGGGRRTKEGKAGGLKSEEIPTWGGRPEGNEKRGVFHSQPARVDRLGQVPVFHDVHIPGVPQHFLSAANSRMCAAPPSWAPKRKKCASRWRVGRIPSCRTRARALACSALCARRKRAHPTHARTLARFSCRQARTHARTHEARRPLGTISLGSHAR